MDNKDKDLLKEIPELGQELNIFGKWAKLFVERYRITFLIILAVFVWGISSYLGLTREAQPEVTIPFGMVMTTYNGASPEEIEYLITDKIEKKMDELDNVKEISSNSGLGYSAVFVEFEAGTDVEDAVQKMRDKVADVQSELPEDADTPKVSDFKTNSSPIMIVNIAGDYDAVELKNIAEDIKDDIERVKNVSDVEIIGGLEREIKITVDPQKLAQYGISLTQISNAISSSNVNFPGGNIKLDEKNYNIRTVGQYSDPKEIENVVVSYIGDSPLYVRDIASVKDDYKDAESFSRMSVGLGTDKASMKKSIAISIKKKDDGDIIKISSAVKKIINDGKGKLYPANLQVEIIGDMSKYVEEQLGTVVSNALSGLFLVIVVLFLFIGLTESIIVSFVIPLAIFMTFGLMKAYGMTFNTISLFSLVLSVGMLVDNGIVIMENIDRLRGKGLDINQASIVGTNQIAIAVASSTLTTVAAFIPLALTGGIMGMYIRSIPMTVIFALSASFFIAVTITPILCSRILGKMEKNKNDIVKHPFRDKLELYGSVVLVFILAMFAFYNSDAKVFKFGFLSFFFGIVAAGAMYMKLKRKSTGRHPIIEWYGEKLQWIVSSKKRNIAVIAISIAAFILSMSLIPLGILKVEMFSDDDFTRLYVNIDAPKGTALERTSLIAEEVEKRIIDVPGIKSFVSNVGSSGADSIDEFDSGAGGTPNMARIIIELYEKKDRDKTSMEISDILRDKVKDIPGAEIKVEEVASGPPSGRPIEVRVIGKDLDAVKKVAKDFAAKLELIEGTRDVKDGMVKGVPEIQVKVDKDKAAAYGLDQMSVAAGIRNAIYGLKTTVFRQDQEEIDVYIRTSEERLNTKIDLENLYFTSRTGQSIPFSQVARIVETESLNSIRHQDTKRLFTVSSDIQKNAVAGDVLKRFEEAIADYELPDGVNIEYGGEDEDMQENFGGMFSNMTIALILVYLILAAQFNSLSQPLIILFTVPLAMIGVMPGLVITGNRFTFVAFIGVVALVGIAVNNGIVLIDYINFLRTKGYSISEAIKETGVARFTPVMATSITTVGGILPLSLKQPFFAPMGYTFIFGLSVTTILTLIVIPVMYSLFEGRRSKRSKLADKEEISI